MLFYNENNTTVNFSITAAATTLKTSLWSLLDDSNTISNQA